MATINSIIERESDTSQAVSLEDDLERVYLQRHIDSGATFTEVRSRVLGALKATDWYRESSAWSKVRDLLEELGTASNQEALMEIVDDLRELAPDEGAEVL